MVSFHAKVFMALKKFAGSIIGKWTCHYIPVDWDETRSTCSSEIFRSRIISQSLQNSHKEFQPYPPLIGMQASGRTEFALLEFEKETSQMEAQYLEHENRSHFSIHIK